MLFNLDLTEIDKINNYQTTSRICGQISFDAGDILNGFVPLRSDFIILLKTDIQIESHILYMYVFDICRQGKFSSRRRG